MYVKITDFTAKDADKAFTDSLRDTGFAVIKNHPIAEELVRNVYQEWQDFFNDPRRMDYQFDREKHDGYFPMSVSETAKGFDLKDIKEYYHLYTWGRFPAFLSNATCELQGELTQLAEKLLGWIELHTPEHIAKDFSMPLSEMIKDCQRTLFRILHYPPLTGDEPAGAVRAAEHGDINLITLLPAATAAGLQARDNQGHWHDVISNFEHIIVNVGDMLELCTQQYYRSTLHRVVNPEGAQAKQSRLSLPLFLHARPEVRLSPEYTAQEFWRERLAELGVM